MKLLWVVLALGFSVIGNDANAQDSITAAPQLNTNDYPTSARAEYVFACMQTNGGTSEVLHRCSCSIDTIASAVTYVDYEKAETILRMRNQGGGGYLAQEFRIPISNAIVRQLDEAQAEADVTCF